MQQNQTNDFKYDENTAALYLSADKNFGSNFSIKVGLRYEYTMITGKRLENEEKNRSHYAHLFPTVNLEWDVSNENKLELSYSMGINRPNFRDLNPFRYYTTTTDYVSGNAYLLPGITQNTELSYDNSKGLYIVAYENHISKGIDYVTIFNKDGSQYTIPENLYNYDKVGTYASYSYNLMKWWNMMLGFDFFYVNSKSYRPEYNVANVSGFGEKIEINSDWMLNKKKTLVFHIGYTHFFPFYDDMRKYNPFELLSADIHYQLFDNRLKLAFVINDPFKQNITKTTKDYTGYVEHVRNDIHSRAIMLRATFPFGGQKVKHVYRDSKETESSRSN